MLSRSAFGWEHVQGWRGHPRSCKCINRSPFLLWSPSWERTGTVGTQVCELGSALFIQSLLHMRKYWKTITQVLIYLRTDFPTSDTRINLCSPVPQRKGGHQLGFSVPENQKFVWKVIFWSQGLLSKHFLLFHRTLLNRSIALWQSWILTVAVPRENHSPGIFSVAVDFHEGDFKPLRRRLVDFALVFI